MSICSTSVNSTPRPCARRPPQRPNRHSRQRTSCSARLLRNRALHFLIHTPSTPTTHRPVDQNSRNLRQHHPARDNTPRQRYPTDLSHPRQWPCAPKPPSTSNNTPRPAVSHPTVPKPRDRNLPLERLQPVDVAFDGAGTVGQGQALADSVEITAEVASEGRPRGWGVLFGVGGPIVETVAVAPGRHHGKLPGVAGEPVQLGITLTQTVQLVRVLADLTHTDGEPAPITAALGHLAPPIRGMSPRPYERGVSVAAHRAATETPSGCVRVPARSGTAWPGPIGSGADQNCSAQESMYPMSPA